MDERRELEAALAIAEAECRKANDDFIHAQADRARAKAEWAEIISLRLKADQDRRKSNLDRRKAGSARDPNIPGRRKTDLDLAAFRQEVDARQKAYLALSNAEAGWARAEAAISQAELAWSGAESRLSAATDKRNSIVAALEALRLAPDKAEFKDRNISNINELSYLFKVKTRINRGAFGAGSVPGLVEISRRTAYTGGAGTGWRLEFVLSAKDLTPAHFLGRAPVLRQAIGSLVLTLAFLQYCYLDAQLQILNLPSVIPQPFS